MTQLTNRLKNRFIVSGGERRSTSLVHEKRLWSLELIANLQIRLGLLQIGPATFNVALSVVPRLRFGRSQTSTNFICCTNK